MRRPMLILALLALAAGTVSPLAAQRRERDRGIVELAPEAVRGGFYIGGGLGAGRESYKYSDGLNYTDGLTKPTLSFRLGGTPNQTTRVGAEIFAWGSEVPEGTESFAAFLLSAQIYPIREAGLFVKGGGGMARSGIDYNNGSSSYETGFAWNVGAGYDIALSRAVGVGPMVDFYQGTFTRRNEPTLTERVMNIGVQVTFQTGGRGR
ncbi:MAG: hypothetical protein V9E87_03060 [Gemmatimonadales bacterium]